MINLKKTILIGTVALTVGTTSITTFAASNSQAQAEAVASLTGRSIESVTSEKSETGKTYGTIAEEAGKLEEFKTESLEIKKYKLTEKVESGLLTQEKASEILATISEKKLNCDGTGAEKIGKENGAGFNSNRRGKSNSERRGSGNGMREKNSSCTSTTN